MEPNPMCALASNQIQCSKHTELSSAQSPSKQAKRAASHKLAHADPLHFAAGRRSLSRRRRRRPSLLRPSARQTTATATATARVRDTKTLTAASPAFPSAAQHRKRRRRDEQQTSLFITAKQRAHTHTHTQSSSVLCLCCRCSHWLLVGVASRMGRRRQSRKLLASSSCSLSLFLSQSIFSRVKCRRNRNGWLSWKRPL